MKNFWDKILKDALLLYCGIYTFTTILNSILYLAKGIYEDPNGNWHELDRAFVVLVGVLAYELIVHIRVKNRFVSALIAYIPTLLLVLGYVWLSGFREPLAQSAYRDIFIYFTMMFLLFSLIYNVIDIKSKRKKV
ncbi:MAG: hypothetical protein GX175_07235 [Halanaerobiaceae bacterium]|nr:hypothetical protein [Halanaerobiaceae bacterium]